MHETIINTTKIHLFSPFCQSTHIFGGKTKIKNNCVRMHYSRKSLLSSNKISPIKKKRYTFTFVWMHYKSKPHEKIKIILIQQQKKI